MLRMTHWLALILILGLGLTVLPLLAEEPDSDDEVADVQRDDDLEKLAMAFELIDLGRKNKSPEALLSAASLLRQLARVEIESLDDNPEVEYAEGADTKKALVDRRAKTPDLEKEAETISAEALRLAKGQGVDVSGLIETMKVRKLARPPVGGPQQINRVLGPGQRHTLRVQLVKGAPTHVVFRAGAPLHFEMVRSDTDSIIADKLTKHFDRQVRVGGVGVRGKAGGGPKVKGPKTQRQRTVANSKARPEKVVKVKEPKKKGKDKPKKEKLANTKPKGKEPAIVPGSVQYTIRIRNPGDHNESYSLYLN